MQVTRFGGTQCARSAGSGTLGGEPVLAGAGQQSPAAPREPRTQGAEQELEVGTGAGGQGAEEGWGADLKDGHPYVSPLRPQPLRRAGLGDCLICTEVT